MRVQILPLAFVDLDKRHNRFVSPSVIYTFMFHTDAVERWSTPV